ncbi:MAG: AAA family ATPase [Lachnospiraceae bacterium]|nr:AAA family ATPase [Lachnospiraceae bacterium]MDE6698138.1 AAA family ATPase [Lachnospiraceae bacterium]
MQTGTPEITKEELERASVIISKINGYFQSKVVGQSYLGFSLLISLLTNGHILLESVPGLAKTTAAKVMTDAVNGEFSRIQCTPDLLPSDIIGTQTFNMATNTFENKLGPVYANFVLLDEVNRSSAKTQSAMLEAMQEHAISIGGQTYKLPEVFVVIATQNPIEQEGTYVLSEAQLDRFLLKVKLAYPGIEEEIEILNRIEANIFTESHAVVNLDDIVFLQKLCKKVYIDPSIKRYIINIVQASRNTDVILPKELAQYVEMGASTRAAISFMEVAKAVALVNGRGYCIPDDVKSMRYSILRHRIILNFAAMADGVKEETIIDAIIGAVKTP